LYLPLYALSQFLLFYLRANSITAFGLKQAQLSSIALAAIWLVLLFVWFHTRGPAPATTEAADGAPAATEDPAGSAVSGHQTAKS
ncbi:MAG: hypothetical protein WAM30_12705, partial [Candidatus Dormiibacterota bacterium]